PLLDGLLQFADILDGQLPVLGKLRHHRLGAAAKETQDLVEQAVPRHVPRDNRLENIRVTDLADTADGVLPLKPVHRGLDSGIGGLRIRKSLLNFANRGFSMPPENLEN